MIRHYRTELSATGHLISECRRKVIFEITETANQCKLRQDGVCQIVRLFLAFFRNYTQNLQNIFTGRSHAVYLAITMKKVAC